MMWGNITQWCKSHYGWLILAFLNLTCILKFGTITSFWILNTGVFSICLLYYFWKPYFNHIGDELYWRTKQYEEQIYDEFAQNIGDRVWEQSKASHKERLDHMLDFIRASSLEHQAKCAIYISNSMSEFMEKSNKITDSLGSDIKSICKQYKDADLTLQNKIETFMNLIDTVQTKVQELSTSHQESQARLDKIVIQFFQHEVLLSFVRNAEESNHKSIIKLTNNQVEILSILYDVHLKSENMRRLYKLIEPYAKEVSELRGSLGYLIKLHGWWWLWLLWGALIPYCVDLGTFMSLQSYIDSMIFMAYMFGHWIGGWDIFVPTMGTLLRTKVSI